MDYKIKQIDQNAVNELSKFYPELLAKLLAGNGIKTQSEAERYLHNDQLYDPCLIHNIDQAVDMILKAIKDKERIGIFGDYDVDGVTSTAIIYEGLTPLGVKVIPRVPDRIHEGYGMSVKAVEELAGKGCTFIVTVDNGIMQHDAIKRAKELVMKVLLTDHHLAGDTLPDADCIIDLHVPEESYPYEDLAGCGVAYKLIAALYKRLQKPLGSRFLDLVAIGTVADLVPLTDENRVLVKRGLDMINDPGYDRMGIKALKAEFNVGNVDSERIAFQLAPALNAPGRLLERGAEISANTLVCKSEKNAAVLAKKLHEVNKDRKEQQKAWIDQAIAELSSRGDLIDEQIMTRFIVMYLPGCPDGVIGLVAGRLTEQYHVPSIVFTSIDEDKAKGSGRSIPGIHLYNELCNCEELLQFGGHSQAAGMSILIRDIPLLQKKLNEQMEKYPADTFKKVITVTQVREASALSVSDLVPLKALEPYGMDNQKPLFLIKNFKCYPYTANRHYAILKEVHIKFLGNKGVEAIGFNLADKYKSLGCPKYMNIIGSFNENHFNGSTSLSIMIEDFEALPDPQSEKTSFQKSLQALV